MTEELMSKKLFDPSEPFSFSEVVMAYAGSRGELVAVITQPVRQAPAMLHLYGHTVAELIELQCKLRKFPANEIRARNLKVAGEALRTLNDTIKGHKPYSRYDALAQPVRHYQSAPDDEAPTPG